MTVPSSPSNDKENKLKTGLTNGNIAVGDVSKTYSKKTPVLKQNVLATNNGSLSVKAVNGVVNGDIKEETADADHEIMEVDTAVDSKESVTPPWGLALGPDPECPVYGNLYPRVTWSYYSSTEQVDQLLAGLNTRGVREGELRDKIIAERDMIESRLKKCKENQYVVSEEAQV